MPAAPALSQSSRDTTPSRSHEAWWGAISFSTKRRTMSRNASWSALNSPRLNTMFSFLVGFRQVQHLFGDERQDQLLGHGRDARDRHFPQQPLHVVFLRVAEAAVRQHGLQA